MTLTRIWIGLLSTFLLCASVVPAQTVTGTIEGVVADTSGGLLPGAMVTAENQDTSFSRSAVSSDTGVFRIPLLPVGTYHVSAELPGFNREVKQGAQLQIGQVLRLEFTLQVGAITQELVVQAQAIEADLEPSRTQTSSIIDEVQIEDLPVNGRQFIDFALLAPGVTIGETTSGSTDVIIEPVTKLSFAGQNIHFNFIAVDGADNISTASGVQRSSPPQESVQEFRVINSNYSTEFGRAVGGIVNIITKSGTNEFHGSVYNFFRNDSLDAKSILASPNPDRPGKFLDELKQNQFGFTLGGPMVRDRTFFFANYEGQRRGEHPFYNSLVTNNIEAINETKVNLFGLAPEQLNTIRTQDKDNIFLRVDHSINDANNVFVRYFIEDSRSKNISPLNDGSDMPSAFKNNFVADQSAVANLTSSLSNSMVNEFRGQFSRRSFDFPTTTTQPALEVTNLFKSGVNRGNPDFYRESRVEFVDNFTWIGGDHVVSFGGNFNFVRTTESFPLFHPFEAQFISLNDYLNGNPVIFFFSRLSEGASAFDTALLSGDRFPASTVETFKASVDHTYTGFFAQDKWQATPNLTLNFGVRWEFETWPSGYVNTDWNNVDPRFGFAWSPGGAHQFVLRGGIGIFRGIIPAPLLVVQEACCGGQQKFPGREEIQTDINGNVPISLGIGLQPDFTPFPGSNGLDFQAALQDMLTTGRYPADIGSFPVVRFTKDHQAPYGIQGTLNLGFEILPETALQLTYLVVRGVHLGSFFNVNTPTEPTGFTDFGKPTFFAPDGNPGRAAPQFALYFEADSRWNSIYHGFLLNLNRRFADNFGFGIGYTYSKSIDDGPNPSFVLIPENANRFDLERSLSSDDVRHRFVANATMNTPENANAFVRGWKFGLIATLHTPHHFQQFVGFDANGEGFPVNDRVGLATRNSFEGDSFQSFDLRLARLFPLGDQLQGEFIAEAFNVFNDTNIRFFNTVYGAPNFIPEGTPGTFLNGSPSPFFGTPRAVFNPRQVQFAFKLTW